MVCLLSAYVDHAGCCSVGHAEFNIRMSFLLLAGAWPLALSIRVHQIVIKIVLYQKRRWCAAGGAHPKLKVNRACCDAGRKRGATVRSKPKLGGSVRSRLMKKLRFK